MAKVFTGKVAIPGDKLDEYFALMNKAEEERVPFYNALTALNNEFKEYLTERFSARTADKHASVVGMFIEFLCRYTDVSNLEEVTVGMANSHFHAWYRRKVLFRDITDSERKVALSKFFLFLAEEKGITNSKVLTSFSKTPKRQSSVTSAKTVTEIQSVPEAKQTIILRAKLENNKRVYRDIELPINQTLYALAEAIILSFDFSFDHAFGYYSTETSRKHYDAEDKYELFADLDVEHEPGIKGVKRTKISSAFTEVGQKMTFLFDYGDEWFFLLEARGFGVKTNGAPYPRVLLSKGEAPEQYPDFED
ncbi:hypothetical protein CCP3SC1_590010 [Gammaproteobacteria bacterium]